uniref:Putative secreted protein n=1 Tax=Ixodes ricinus TaxID=34613 RepID=A0A6B0UMS0_IXORI
MSQILIVTFPLVTFRMLKPTVGIMSSQNCPEAMTFTKVVFPEYWSPTSVSSISSFQKRLLNQSRILLMSDNISSAGSVHRPIADGVEHARDRRQRPPAANANETSEPSELPSRKQQQKS